MARYIDADYACEAVGFDEFTETLNMFPTEDVAPVVHAKWESQGWMDDMYDSYFKCSKCGRITEVAHSDDVNTKCPYCHCGAKMDG